MKALVASLCFVVMSVFIIPSGAQAVSLYTAPYPRTDSISCDIVNVSGIVLLVDIEVRDGDGNVLNLPWEFELPPGSTIGGLSGNTLARYCKFRVKAKNRSKKAKKRMVRATATFIDGGVITHSTPAR